MTFRVRAFLRWLVIAPKRVYTGLGVPFAAMLLAGALPISGELAARIAGYLVTIAGVALVVADIYHRGSSESRPSPLQELLYWGAQFPSFFRPARQVRLEAKATGTFSASATLSIWITVPEGATLQQRM